MPEHPLQRQPFARLGYCALAPLSGVARKLLFRQVRIGRDGKRFVIYKIRTMRGDGTDDYRPTAHDDPRIYPWARWIRRWWLDELPQLVHLARGEMTVIGPRPLAEADFARLPPDLRALRTQFKPGCINPKYASLQPFDWDATVATEREYLRERQRRPLRTDLRYLARILYNFVFRGVRGR